MAHLVRAIDLATEVATMAAGDRQRAAAEDEARAGDDALADRLAQPERQHPFAAAIADRRHPRLERGEHIAMGLQEQEFIW